MSKNTKKDRSPGRAGRQNARRGPTSRSGSGRAAGAKKSKGSSSKPAAAGVDVPDILKGRKQLTADETFTFGCHAGLPCFTRCCADINILLTPLDALRLSRRLGIATGEFIERHTLTPITKSLHLPVLMMKMGDDPGKRCPFVGEDGCSVYEARPWSCRMYPVGMALPPARAGVDPKPVYFLFEDDFCEGRATGQEWTIESWRESQGVREREELESGFQGIVSHPWFIGGRLLDPKRMEMFHMACYDLDTFRRFVFSSSFLERFDVEADLIARLRTDDEALLSFAFRWLRFALFGEPSLSVKSGPIKCGRNP